MKSVAVATLGLFGALASANNHIRHLHFPRSNATTTAAEAATTLTVIATQVHTITSCAPTVTNCPARTNHTGYSALPESAKTTVVVTDTIVLATTVCPVAQASSVSSSLIGAHSSGLITGTTLTTPLAYTPPPTAVGSSAAAVTGDLSTTDVVSQQTYTMTLGKGTDASTVTTTVLATTKSVITVTSHIGSAPTPSNGGYGGPPGETGESAEPTTTVTATSTGTRTVTVEKPSQTPGGSYGSGTPGSGSPGAGAPGNGPPGVSSEGCDGAATATVTVTVAQQTVTVPASTVYVTVLPGSQSSAASAAQPTYAPPPPVSDQSVPTTTDVVAPVSTGSSGATPTSSDCDDSTVTLKATVTVAPYQITNGTHTSGAAGPSGFARLRR